VLGTAKHYVGDGGTAWGSSTTGDYEIDQGVTEVDEATLRAVHLPPYAALIEAGAQNVMISYSSWGGMKMHGQDYLINDVLLGELGFDGFIVSDWAGIDQVDPDFYTSVVRAINAGVDMNMVPYDANMFIEALTEAVANGDVSMERIDEAVSNILKVKFEMGLFEHPFSNPDLVPLVGSDEHRAVAREAVAQTQVLLKNDGDMLPLAKELPTLYVAGAAADDIGIQSGGWTIEWQGKKGDITPGTTILEGIQNTVSAETNVIFNPYAQFGDITSDGPVVCIGVVGEEPYAEGQGDSATLRLPVNDLRTINRLADMCDQLAVVLVSGRPLIIADQIENWDALVAAWLPGTEGQGVADVLFGDQPFTGKTAFTWPISADQLPLDFTTITEEDVLFPFGYGLETQ
jgi:beta-glucosidase